MTSPPPMSTNARSEFWSTLNPVKGSVSTGAGGVFTTFSPSTTVTGTTTRFDGSGGFSCDRICPTLVISVGSVASGSGTSTVTANVGVSLSPGCIVPMSQVTTSLAESYDAAHGLAQSAEPDL